MISKIEDKVAEVLKKVQSFDSDIRGLMYLLPMFSGGADPTINKTYCQTVIDSIPLEELSEEITKLFNIIPSAKSFKEVVSAVFSGNEEKYSLVSCLVILEKNILDERGKKKLGIQLKNFKRDIVEQLKLAYDEKCKNTLREYMACIKENDEAQKNKSLKLICTKRELKDTNIEKTQTVFEDSLFESLSNHCILTHREIMEEINSSKSIVSLFETLDKFQKRPDTSTSSFSSLLEFLKEVDIPQVKKLYDPISFRRLKGKLKSRFSLEIKIEKDPLIKGTVHIIGNYILLSNILKNKEFKEILNDSNVNTFVFNGGCKIFFDQKDEEGKGSSFICRGKSLVFDAPEMEVIGDKRTINTSGDDGKNTFLESKAKNGWERGLSTKGNYGVDGELGEPGKNAGDIVIITKHFINENALHYVANGGKGAPGQDGGDGEPGEDGLDGKNGRINFDPSSRFSLYGNSVLISGTEGEIGKKGGDGGEAGLGGQGGQCGNVEIIVANASINVDERCDAKDGENGKHADPGEGGEGGKGGLRGFDEGVRWKGWLICISGKKILRGKLTLVPYDIFLYGRVYWLEQEEDEEKFRNNDKNRAQSGAKGKGGKEADKESVGNSRAVKNKEEMARIISVLKEKNSLSLDASVDYDSSVKELNSQISILGNEIEEIEKVKLAYERKVHLLNEKKKVVEQVFDRALIQISEHNKNKKIEKQSERVIYYTGSNLKSTYSPKFKYDDTITSVNEHQGLMLGIIENSCDSKNKKKCLEIIINTKLYLISDLSEAVVSIDKLVNWLNKSNLIKLEGIKGKIAIVDELISVLKKENRFTVKDLSREFRKYSILTLKERNESVIQHVISLYLNIYMSLIKEGFKENYKEYANKKVFKNLMISLELISDFSSQRSYDMGNINNRIDEFQMLIPKLFQLKKDERISTFRLEECFSHLEKDFALSVLVNKYPDKIFLRKIMSSEEIKDDCGYSELLVDIRAGVTAESILKKLRENIQLHENKESDSGQENLLSQLVKFCDSVSQSSFVEYVYEKSMSMSRLYNVDLISVNKDVKKLICQVEMLSLKAIKLDLKFCKGSIYDELRGLVSLRDDCKIHRSLGLYLLKQTEKKKWFFLSPSIKDCISNIFNDFSDSKSNQDMAKNIEKLKMLILVSDYIRYSEEEIDLLHEYVLLHSDSAVDEEMKKLFLVLKNILDKQLNVGIEDGRAAYAKV